MYCLRTSVFRSLLVGVLLLPPSVSADPFHITKGPASLHADLKDYKDDKATLRLSGVITLTYTLKDKAHVKPKLDLTVLKRDMWEVYPESPKTSKDKDNVNWRQRVRIEPRMPGDIPLSFPKLQYETKSGELKTFDWGIITVKVPTPVGDLSLEGLEDIPAIEKVPPAPPPPEFPWVPIGIFFGAVLILAVVVTLWTNLKRRKVEEPPPEGIHEQLERLATTVPTAKEELRERYSQLAVLFLGFLRERFEIPKDNQTSAEVMEWLERADGVSEETVSSVREVIEECDLIRFTPLTPNPSNFVVTTKKAHEVVRQLFGTPENTKVSPT